VIGRLKEYFRCGTIRRDYSDQTVKYEVRSVKELVENIIPHFRKHPLLSSKQSDFETWAAVCERMYRQEHLEAEGFEAIVRLAHQVNAGKRRYTLDEILSREEDEGIVYATGNC
jgi:hypothetical protein